MHWHFPYSEEENRMKKLKLDLDALKIDSFETTAARQQAPRGTVLGQTGEPETCDGALSQCLCYFETSVQDCSSTTNLGDMCTGPEWCPVTGMSNCPSEIFVCEPSVIDRTCLVTCNEYTDCPC